MAIDAKSWVRSARIYSRVLLAGGGSESVSPGGRPPCMAWPPHGGLHSRASTCTPRGPGLTSWHSINAVLSREHAYHSDDRGWDSHYPAGVVHGSAWDVKP